MIVCVTEGRREGGRGREGGTEGRTGGVGRDGSQKTRTPHRDVGNEVNPLHCIHQGLNHFQHQWGNTLDRHFDVQNLPTRNAAVRWHRNLWFSRRVHLYIHYMEFLGIVHEDNNNLAWW